MTVMMLDEFSDGFHSVRMLQSSMLNQRVVSPVNRALADARQPCQAPRLRRTSASP
jgi:hypothetical protein